MEKWKLATDRGMAGTLTQRLEGEGGVARKELCITEDHSGSWNAGGEKH